MRAINFLSLFILLATGSMPARAECPTNAKEFIPWYTDLIKSASYNSYWDLAHPAVFLRLCFGFDSSEMRDGYLTNKSFGGELLEKFPKEDRWVLDACTGPAIKMEHTLSYDNKVGILKRKETGVRNVVLPRALLDKKLRDLLASKNATQAEIDIAIKDLKRQLPEEAHVFQYVSGTVHRRSFVIVLPSDKENIVVHTHEGQEHMAYNILRVNKMDREGKPTNLPTVDFFQMNGAESVAQLQEKRCISCHRGGSIAILPEGDKFISHEPGMTGPEIKKWWNDIRPKHQDLSNYDTSNLGPSMGPDDYAGRTDDFIKKCASSEIPNPNTATMGKIRKAMNCTGCHSMDGRDEHLQFPMHTPDFKFKVFDNIILSGHMPKDLDASLTEPEKKALLKCLKYEFFGGFKDQTLSQGNPDPGILIKWLLPATCDFKSAPNNQSTSLPEIKQ